MFFTKMPSCEVCYRSIFFTGLYLALCCSICDLQFEHSLQKLQLSKKVDKTGC